MTERKVKLDRANKSILLRALGDVYYGQRARGGSTEVANSEFLVMLNQSATDREELAKLLNISDNQLGYVTNVPAGCGLIRCAGNIVPFTNSFPKDTKLYKLMSTNPSEKKE